MAELFLRVPGMALWLQAFTILLLFITVACIAILLRRRPSIDLSPVLIRFDPIEKAQDRAEKSLRDEIARNREESSASALQNRQEVISTLNGFASALQSRMTEISSLQKDQLDSFAKQLLVLTQTNEQKFEHMRSTIEEKLTYVQEATQGQLSRVREDFAAAAKGLREEVVNSLKLSNDTIVNSVDGMGALQREQLEGFSKQLSALTQSNELRYEAMRATIEERLLVLQDENRKQLTQIRDDSGSHAKTLREEVIVSLKNSTDTQLKGMGQMGAMQRDQLDAFAKQLATLTQSNEQKLERMRDTIEQHLTALQQENVKQLNKVREDTSTSARELREEVGLSLKDFRDSLISNMGEMASLQKWQLGIFEERLLKLTDTNDQKLSGMRETIEQRLNALMSETGKKLDQMREETGSNAKQQRDETTQSLKGFSDSANKSIAEMGGLLRGQMESFSGQIQKLTVSNENKLESVRSTVEIQLKQIQEDNSRQLDQMRSTVDEKLHGTLEKRLGESFKQVSERLEQVHKGLGEMQSLASGVGDLKKALTNVKTRGCWGEIQLEALLEDILAPEQFERNVKTNETSGEMVEFAIKLPGRDEGSKDPLWLPIDAKFPIEDYQRLVDAQERADAEAAEVSSRMLMARIKGCAKDICDKYLCPPRTTDFGIMFLPTEGLYAEVVRRAGLVESIQRECRVVIAGPTTIAALLNSLQMGFRTLAIQKRSSEVWKILGAVKTEFGKFGDVLDGVKKKLEQATNTMDGAARRSRAIERKLRNVEALPPGETQLLLVGAESDSEFDD